MPELEELKAALSRGRNAIKALLREWLRKGEATRLVGLYGQLCEEQRQSICHVLLEFLCREKPVNWSPDARTDLIIATGAYFKGSEAVPILAKLDKLCTGFVPQPDGGDDLKRICQHSCRQGFIPLRLSCQG